MDKEKPIFSGDYSKDMWKEINDAKTIKDLRSALYFVCCRLQELEAKLARERKQGKYYAEYLSRRGPMKRK